MTRAGLFALVLAGAPLPGLCLETGVLQLVREEAYEALDLPLGPAQEGALPVETFLGARRDEAWRLPAGQSTLALLAIQQRAAEAEGFEIVFTCRDRACGGYDFRRAFDVLPAPAMYVDFSDFRFFSARRGEDALAVLVSRSRNAGHVQISRVTGAALPQTAQPAPLESWEADLEREGRAVLEGLSFASGSSEIEGDTTAISRLAHYLKDHPRQKVVLVGHSDASGSLAANLALSKARAAAVEALLIRDHAIAPARLDAQGVGFLAPRAAHLSAAALGNRRIEVVLLP